MQVTRKDAAISAPVDDAFPGSFEAILSAPTKDRDGETLLPEEWKQPLPEHITVDRDHEMTVAGTIGSAKPWIDEKGNLRISGTFASTPKAQEVRTLMQEGHIRTTSVAFMSEKTQKDGVTAVTRELLNAGIVAIPSNREALVLSAKGLKAGARNSSADQVHLDAIARHAIALGANVATGGDDTDANPDVAAGKSATVKDADTEDAADPAALAAATDAALDEAINLLATVDPTTLPAAVQQAIALIQAADATVDELLDALGIPDPDEDADSAAPEAPAAVTAAAPKAAALAAVEAKGAAVEDDSIDPIAARQRYYATLSEGN